MKQIEALTKEKKFAKSEKSLVEEKEKLLKSQRSLKDEKDKSLIFKKISFRTNTKLKKEIESLKSMLQKFTIRSQKLQTILNNQRQFLIKLELGTIH